MSSSNCGDCADYEEYVPRLEKELAYFKAIYNPLIDGAARDTNRINELEKELALKDVWVRHHQRCVEICMDERSKLEKKLEESRHDFDVLKDGHTDLEYQLEQQQIMNPISVEMLATISDLSWKLSVAMKVIEMQLSPIFDNECEGCREAERVARDALKKITNVSEKDKQYETK